MLNLNIVKHNNTDVMSSVDLAELCVGTDKDAHSNFMKKAKIVLSDSIVNFYSHIRKLIPEDNSLKPS